MITWMQRHKKYLIITMWISTIAFIGAGFVGWGQYSYGDKASAIAKVGDIPVSNADLQKSYSRLYAQYAQIFQGNFDEEKAKQFGLQKQAMRQLIDEALMLNLAQSYSLRVSDEELLREIQSQNVFQNNGVFDKDIYQKTLKQNHLTMKSYEDDVRKSLLIRKLLALFAPEALPLEEELLSSAQGIQDTIGYKILGADMVEVTLSDDNLRQYWEAHKNEYMTLPLYKISVVKQTRIASHATEKDLLAYYNENKHDFRDGEGAIMDFEAARSKVQDALDDKTTKKAALKKYINFKKGKLDPAVAVEQVALDSSSNLLDADVFKEITELSLQKPFLKPRKSGDSYIIVKLEAVVEPQTKSFEEAKAAVAIAYKESQTARLLQELATQTLAEFTAAKTLTVTPEQIPEIDGLTPKEASVLVKAIFNKQDKRGFITLSHEKIVLYDILEQKLLNTSITDQEKNVIQLKEELLNRGLIQELESVYPVEMYVKGL